MNSERVKIAGVGVDVVTKDQVLEWLERQLSEGSGLMKVATVNPEQVVQAQDDSEFMQVLGEVDLVLPDGVGVVGAMKLLERKEKREKRKNERVAGIEVGEKNKEYRNSGIQESRVRVGRVAGIEVAEDLIQYCQQKGLRVFMLGGHCKSVEDFSVFNLGYGKDSRERAPGFEMKYDAGAADVAVETDGERERVLERIGEFRPHLLLVAYGAPWQEKWVAVNKDALERAGVRVAMVVGGAFDVWAGKVKRAPGVLRMVGLEWLWRLVQEPWRWKRQLRLIRFIGLLGGQLLRLKER